MNKKAKLCKALLKGEVVSILTGFLRFKITNIPREISRQIEQDFDVRVSKVRKDFKTEDGESGYYFEYRLNYVQDNLEGIEKMKAYVSEQEGAAYSLPVKRGKKLVHTEKNDQEWFEKPFIQKDLFTE